MLSKLNHWHKTKLGLLAFGLVELLIVFGLGNWAFGDGSLWLWLFAVIFFVGSLQNFGKLIGVFVHDTRQTSQA